MIVMNEKINSFCKELRTKLDAVEKRIKDLNASTKGATEKAKLEACLLYTSDAADE